MTDFFKNNQIALRHCLLYEFLQGKPAGKALLDFERTVGKTVMNKKETQIWFRRFAKGKFYKNSKKHDQVTIKNIIQSDKKALRTCILYLSLKSQKKTEENRYLLNSMDVREEHDLFRFNQSFVMYEEFRKVIGDDVMEYQEFDFWFYRFLNGEFDLDFERDNVKKIYELSNMPLDVMEKVVEYLDIFDRLSLTKTSRSLHTFTEDQKLFHQTLEITLGRSGSSKIRFDEKSFRSYTDWEEAILDFKKIIENPKLHLHTLLIDSSYCLVDPFSDKKHSLKPSNHQLHVKKLSFKGYLKTLRDILTCLKPKYLTDIHIVELRNSVFYRNLMEEIGQLEQWKKAQNFSMDYWFVGSLRYLYHFKEFSVRYEELSVGDIRDMKEILFKSQVFEKSSLSLFVPIDDSAIEEEFGEVVRGRPNTFHHLIPNSNEYFEITLNEKKIEITRKMR